jgi:mono/diheme cytochrome c family protein
MKVLMRIPVALVALSAWSCGGAPQDAPEADAPAPAVGELTAFQLEHGIGPVTQPVELGAPDHELAEAGEELFKLKCMACHRTGERYIGPALGDVLDRRSPAYVMNMMMNPTEMTERHPEAKALLAEYLAPMPSQDLTEADARAE